MVQVNEQDAERTAALVARAVITRDTQVYHWNADNVLCRTDSVGTYTVWVDGAPLVNMRADWQKLRDDCDNLEKQTRRLSTRVRCWRIAVVLSPIAAGISLGIIGMRLMRYFYE